MSNKKTGFTLVELAIGISVMSILSMVIIGVGKLKDIATTRAIIAEQHKFQRSIQDFYNAQKAFPGDFLDAQYSLSKEGFATSTLSTVIKKDIEEKVAISGNEDGKISNKLKTLNISGANIKYSESLQVWKHLYLSGIILTPYSGICNSNDANQCIKLGYNIPKSQNFSDSIGYNLLFPSEIANAEFIDYSTDYSYYYQSSIFKNKNILILASFITQDDNGRGTTGGVSSEIAQMIDIKFDDGKPMTGNIVAMNDISPTNKCHNKTHETSGNINDTEYLGRSLSAGCILMFPLN